MKTLVIFEVRDRLISLKLEDLAVPPCEGRCYLFSGRRYVAFELLEFLGSRTLLGEKVSGSEKLLAVLKSAYGDEAKVAALLAGLTDVGSGSEQEDPDAATGGSGPTGLIVPGEPEIEDFDHVLLVRLKRVSSDAQPAIRLASFVSDDTVEDDGGNEIDAGEAAAS